MKVAIYGMTKAGLRGGPGERGDMIGQAMAAGLKRHNVPHTMHARFDGVVADVAIAYGWINELKDKVFSAYRDAGKRFVFIDLGYWNRGTRGAYRVSVDSWDSADNMLRNCPDGRFRESRITLRSDWNPESRDVMIVGMSDKAAWTHGYRFNEWENKAKAFLEDKYLGKGFRFYIRQKPRGKEASRAVPIEQALKNTRFVISHHSNVAVDCLIAGIPYTCKKGVARFLSPTSHREYGEVYTGVADADIINPHFPAYEDRISLLNDIAYVQWTVKEMIGGHCWDYLKEVMGCA